MIDVYAAEHVFFYNQPVDLRKSFCGLYAIAQNHIKQSPLNGDLFIFLNKSRTTLKALQFDGTGICVFSKKLTKGRFPNIFEQDTGIAPTITPQQLEAIIHGKRLSFFQTYHRNVA